MIKFINTYNLAVGAVITLLTAIFGAFWYLFAAYFLLNILDWGTGWYRAYKLHQESSAEGLKGILKKLGYWVIILVAFLMPSIFVNMGRDILNIDLTILTMVGWFTLACLLVNEMRSILENLVACGYHVPAVLIKGLAVTEQILKEKEEK